MTFLLLLIFAHVLSDFVLQTDPVVKAKCKGHFKGYLYHGLVVFSCTLVLTHFYGLVSLYISAIIVVIHIAIDYIKNLLPFKKGSWASLHFFILDQFLHYITIFMIWTNFTVNADSHITGIYLSLLPAITLPVTTQQQLIQLFSVNKLLLLSITYILTTFGGSVLIRLFLDCILKRPEQQKINGVTIIPTAVQYATGTYIGILERAIILTLVMYNSLPSVAFVLTAKSVARFNELNNKDFAEYYLIGTLTSASLAVAAGLILQQILPLLNY